MHGKETLGVRGRSLRILERLGQIVGLDKVVSEHRRELVRYTIGPEGIVVGEALTDYQGILVGAPRRISEPREDWT